MSVMRNGKAFSYSPGRSRFVIIGFTVDGKKFRKTTSNWLYANGINLFRGRVWHWLDGKRELVKHVWN